MLKAELVQYTAGTTLHEVELISKGTFLRRVLNNGEEMKSETQLKTQ